MAAEEESLRGGDYGDVFDVHGRIAAADRRGVVGAADGAAETPLIERLLGKPMAKKDHQCNAGKYCGAMDAVLKENGSLCTGTILSTGEQKVVYKPNKKSPSYLLEWCPWCKGSLRGKS